MILDLRQLSIGITFGYPECCCKHFASNEDPADGLPEDYIFMGTGYVPCPECRELEPKALLGYIDTHRLFPNMFPQDNLGRPGTTTREELLRRFNDESNY